MTTTILFAYPLLAFFRRIRRVDARYAYLVVRDGFVPLKRREGCLSAILRYEKYVARPKQRMRFGDIEYLTDVVDVLLSDYEEISSFFQTILQEEYDEPIEESFSELGKLWDKKYDEMYGIGKAVRERLAKRQREKELKRCQLLDTMQRRKQLYCSR
jgi:hypothetical protein